MVASPTPDLRYKRQLDELSKVTGWVIHDVRRTARTRWAAIPNVKTEVAEAALAHVLPGMHKVYNLHSYRDEKLDLFCKWERLLIAIVHPPATSNVVSLPRKRITLPRRKIA